MATEVLVNQKYHWYCHCCGYKNAMDTENCKVCKRHESYVLEGYPLPMHGQGAQLFRPSQIEHVLTNIHETDSVHWTPLHNACVNGNSAAAIRLMELNGVIEATTDKGQTALHLAVFAGSVETVRALLVKGANPNAVTKFELNTPLHLACEGSWKEIMDLLIDARANVNASNLLQRRPLHYAAAAGRADMGAHLLKAGAMPGATDVHGWNARQMAELHGHRSFQELIIRVTSIEKQVVIKELPPAPWHGTLWDEVVAANQKAHEADLKAQQVQEQTRREVAIARGRALEAKAQVSVGW